MFHYHTDHIGTPREITNAKAEVVWSSTFKTYGALALAHVNELDNPLRFQGQYHDDETGLHYNRHRYYDPHCGQFTTQDPIGLLGGMNAYQYATNPLTWVDPWGLTSKELYEDGASPASWGLSISETKTVLSSAQTPYKGSTVVGHALSKHSGRPATFSNPNVSGAEVWGRTQGKMSTWNEQGMSHLKDIIRAPGEFKPVKDGSLEFLEKRLPDGRGVRLNQDMTFKGFVD